jgi:hypothetical protein
MKYTVTLLNTRIHRMTNNSAVSVLFVVCASSTTFYYPVLIAFSEIFLYWAFLSDSSRWAARWGRRVWTVQFPLCRTRGFFYQNISDFFNNNQGSWGVRNGALFWSVFD